MRTIELQELMRGTEFVNVRSCLESGGIVCLPSFELSNFGRLDQSQSRKCPFVFETSHGESPIPRLYPELRRSQNRGDSYSFEGKSTRQGIVARRIDDSIFAERGNHPDADPQTSHEIGWQDRRSRAI